MKNLKLFFLCFLLFLFSCSTQQDMNMGNPLFPELDVDDNGEVSTYGADIIDPSEYNDDEVIDSEDISAFSIYDDLYDDTGDFDTTEDATRGSMTRATANDYPIVKNFQESLNAKIVQYLLKAWGYTIAVDGQYGEKSENVVKSFQGSHGLTKDGIVGTATWGKLIITVNEGDKNEAVRALQELLRYRYNYSLSVDGEFGPETKGCVIKFQNKYQLLQDGIVGQNTWKYLIAGVKSSTNSNPSPNEFWEARKSSWIFPFKATLALSATTGGRYFGAPRNSGSRAHAGVDLIPSSGPNTRIYAMTSGTVIAYYYFYYGTYALEVKSTDGTIIRYGEISSTLRAGQNVSKGTYLGKIIRNTSSGSYMLHLEVFKGTKTGSLTNRNNHTYPYVPYKNYQRRSDLLNPMGVVKLPKP